MKHIEVLEGLTTIANVYCVPTTCLAEFQELYVFTLISTLPYYQVNTIMVLIS